MNENEFLLPGQLVRVISPESIKEMGVVGIVTKANYRLQQRDIWIPDLSREIAFEIYQLEIIGGEG